MITPEQYVIIILAAGKSGRLGQPKQLLNFKNSSFIKKITSIALEVSSQIIVVTGAVNEMINRELKELPVIISHNEDFETGIASSIRKGVKVALEKFHPTGILITVCDQPYVCSSLLHLIIETANTTGKNIIASAYSDTLGTPVFFKEKFFQDLLKLEGDSGAKKIILQNLDETAKVNFPEGSIDIDTKDDYQALCL